MHIRRDRIVELIREMPTATEDQIAWALVEEISATRAKLLQHIFDGHRGSNGRLTIQTDPRLYRNPRALVDQAMRFSTLALNMIVKIPVTTAGVKAIEEATAKGVNINATVCFSLSQSVAVAEAIERGLQLERYHGCQPD
jgi:transaldolase